MFRRIVLMLMAICCADDPLAAGLDLSGVQSVDLTYTYDERTLYWPTSPTRFKLTELEHGETEGGYFYASNAFCTPEHGGTHLDAPLHFAEGGLSSEQIPIERLMGPGVVIDVAAKAAADRDYLLSIADVHQWEAKHGPIPAGAMVFLRTGWGRFWPDAKSYLGDDTPGDASGLHFPSYGAEAATFLIEERRVVALGVDTASIDYGPSADFLVHRIAGAANVVGIENLARLELVPEAGAWIIALPIKIGAGSGGPVRVIALMRE